MNLLIIPKMDFIIVKNMRKIFERGNSKNEPKDPSSSLKDSLWYSSASATGKTRCGNPDVSDKYAIETTKKTNEKK
jgi:hypothetical protein